MFRHKEEEIAALPWIIKPYQSSGPWPSDEIFSDVHVSPVLSTNVKRSYLPPNHGEPCSKVGKICHSCREAWVALGRAVQASGFMSKPFLDGLRMVNFPGQGVLSGFVHCSFSSTHSNADHGGAEQIIFGESVWELLKMPTDIQKHGWWGEGRGREASWKRSLRETTIKSWWWQRALMGHYSEAVTQLPYNLNEMIWKFNVGNRRGCSGFDGCVAFINVLLK